MGRHRNFFNELINHFPELFFTAVSFESAIDAGIIIVEKQNGSRLWLIRSTDKCMDRDYEYYKTLRELDLQSKKATTPEEEIFFEKMKEYIRNNVDNRILFWKETRYMYYSYCSVEKLQSMLKEIDGKDNVYNWYVFKKVGRYSIAISKPWWYEE